MLLSHPTRHRAATCDSITQPQMAIVPRLRNPALNEQDSHVVYKAISRIKMF